MDVLPLPEPPSTARAACALLALDDAGQCLLLAGDALVIGHARGGRADLPLLADIASEHARLERFESLRAGPRWRAVPIGDARLCVDGRAVGAEGMELADGAELELARNAVLRFALPDPASSSARLELLGGLECAGTRVVLALGPGRGGRLRLGRGGQRHVPSPSLDQDVELVWRPGVLVVRAPLGLARPGEEPRAEIELDFPPLRREELRLRRAAASGASATAGAPAASGASAPAGASAGAVGPPVSLILDACYLGER